MARPNPISVLKEGAELAADKLGPAAKQSAARQAGFAGVAASRYTPTKTSDILHEIYINNMLSGVSTQMLNMFSTATQPILGIMDTANKALLTTFSKPENKTYYSEVVGEAYGMMHGIMKALQFAGRTAESKAAGQFTGAETIAKDLGISPGVLASSRLEHTNRALSSEGIELDPESLVGRIADGLGTLVNLPVSALNTSDLFFKVMRDDMSKHRWAAKQVAQGKYPSIREAYEASLTDPTAIKQAVADAEYTTFTGRPNIPMLSWITDTAAEKLPGMRWVIPFKRTIANLAEQSIERTPLALMNPTMGKRLISANPEERITAQARLLTGMAVLTTLAYTLGDYITGEPPRGAMAREQWQKINGMPFSLQFGADQKAIRLDNLGVMGQLLKAVAMFRQRIDSMTDEELGIYTDPEALTDYVKNQNATALMEELSTFVTPVVDMLTDVFWAESIVGLTSAYERSQRDNNFTPLYQYIENIAARTMPFTGATAWEHVMSGQDKTARRWTQIGDSFRMQIPELRKHVWARYDFLGNEMIHNRLRGPGQTDPMAPYDPNNSIYKTMEKLGIEPKARSPFIDMPSQGGIPGSQLKLTQEEWDRMHQYIREGIWVDQKDFTGKPIKENGKPVRKQVMPSLEQTINKTFGDLGLSRMEPELQRAYFNTIRDNYHKQIKQYMLGADPTFSLRAKEQMQLDAAKAEAIGRQTEANMQGPMPEWRGSK